MKSEYGLSTLGRPIVIAEVGDAPIIRQAFVVISLLLGAWVLLHVNGSVAVRSLRGAGKLSVASFAVLVMYNVHQVIHIAHFADNIARPVAYYEPKWLYDKYLLSTMEITFYFNVVVSIFGARVAVALFHELASLISTLEQAGDDTSDIKSLLSLNGQSAPGVAPTRSLVNKLLLYTSSAAMTVMHYRVESYRLYSAFTTFTIAGEGLAGVALALVLWFLKTLLPLASTNEAGVSEEPSPEVSSTASTSKTFPSSPEHGDTVVRKTETNPIRSARRRSPARA